MRQFLLSVYETEDITNDDTKAFLDQKTDDGIRELINEFMPFPMDITNKELDHFLAFLQAPENRPLTANSQVALIPHTLIASQQETIEDRYPNAKLCRYKFYDAVRYSTGQHQVLDMLLLSEDCIEPKSIHLDTTNKNSLRITDRFHLYQTIKSILLLESSQPLEGRFNQFAANLIAALKKCQHQLSADHISGDKFAWVLDSNAHSDSQFNLYPLSLHNAAAQLQPDTLPAIKNILTDLFLEDFVNQHRDRLSYLYKDKLKEKVMRAALERALDNVSLPGLSYEAVNKCAIEYINQAVRNYVAKQKTYSSVSNNPLSLMRKNKKETGPQPKHVQGAFQVANTHH